ncbi:protein ABHD15-like [Haliotis asinina]|uniref:protein ABHD15-like n=1 Tax=Haliotis asinina TaxID=109174 RepID=UPI00353225B1
MLMSSVFWMMLSYPFTVVMTFLSTVVLTAVVYVKSLFRPKESIPRLYFRDSAMAQHIISKCTSLRRPMRLPVWLQNAHVQTLCGFFLKLVRTQFRREYVQLEDDGVVALDWTATSRYMGSATPIIILVPDLNGDAASMAQYCNVFTSRGYRAVIFNRRGHGGSFLTSAGLKAYGCCSDLRCAVQSLRHRFPGSSIAGLGTGAGADLFMSYLGEFGSSSLLCSVTCISPTYDSEDVYMNKIPKLYEMTYLMHLKKILGRYSESFSKVVDVDAAIRAWSFKDYDSHVYSKLAGYPGLEEYWEENSPMRDVDEISVPVLCINSMDDPISVKENIPYDLFKSSLNFFLVTLERGGHCGFYEKATGSAWTVNPALDFIESVFSFPSAIPSKQRIVGERAWNR